MVSTSSPEILVSKASPPLESALPCTEPCVESCVETCVETCAEPAEDSSLYPQSWLGKLFHRAFYNALQLALGELRQEPKSMIILGGTRQRLLAQKMALLLPFTTIALVDPDATETQKAKAEINCRFGFIHASLEALPFEDASVDLVLAHNLDAFTRNTSQALLEIQRVARGGNFITTRIHPNAYQLLQAIPMGKTALREAGVLTGPSSARVSPKRLARMLEVIGHSSLTLNPFPWTLWQVDIRS